MSRSSIWIFAVLVASAVAVGASEGWEIGECPENPVNVRRPACPEGRRFEGGSCQSGPNWLGHMSVCRLEDCNTCTDDETLIAATGECETEGALVRAGTPACPANRRFTSGSCQSGPNWLGHMSICRLEDCAVCREDQMLDLEHGLCCDVPY